MKQLSLLTKITVGSLTYKRTTCIIRTPLTQFSSSLTEERAPLVSIFFFLPSARRSRPGAELTGRSGSRGGFTRRRWLTGGVVSRRWLARGGCAGSGGREAVRGRAAALAPAAAEACTRWGWGPARGALAVAGGKRCGRAAASSRPRRRRLAHGGVASPWRSAGGGGREATREGSSARACGGRAHPRRRWSVRGRGKSEEKRTGTNIMSGS
jgi:hypothetical protein